MRESFLEETLSADRARAGRTGAPRNGRRPGGRWSAGRRCALRHWARAVHLAARGGYVIPASRVPAGALAPPAAPPPRAFIARDWQTSDASRRENTPTRPSFRGGAIATAQ